MAVSPSSSLGVVLSLLVFWGALAAVAVARIVGPRRSPMPRDDEETPVPRDDEASVSCDEEVTEDGAGSSFPAGSQCEGDDSDFVSEAE
mmetsp:Transcript_12356/g.36288  ORF Transcript_12356/g.36288 Transcript_12356/m.36288 type:complete len:89 (-) Transcript_12356:240-506(-)